MKYDIEKIKLWLQNRLSEERYLHSLGSAEMAVYLAEKFNADAEKAEIAALIHDNSKCLSDEELEKTVQENNIEISETEKLSRKTLHAPVSAFIAEKELGITDTDILNSVRYHTLGRLNMSLLEQVVFISDKIEPNTREEKFSQKVLSKIEGAENLNRALLLCYKETIKSLLKRKLYINSQTIDVWNDLILKLKNEQN